MQNETSANFFWRKDKENFLRVTAKKIEQTYISIMLLVKLIGVNKGRRVTLKYFSILIKVSRKHRTFVQLFAR